MNKQGEDSLAPGADAKEEANLASGSPTLRCKQLAPGSKFCQAPRKAKGNTRCNSFEDLMSSAFVDELPRSFSFVGARAVDNHDGSTAHTKPPHYAPAYGKRYDGKTLPPAVPLPPPMVKGSSASGARTAVSPQGLPSPASLPPPSMQTGYGLPSVPLTSPVHHPLSTADFSPKHAASAMDNNFGRIFSALGSQSSGSVSTAAYRSALLATGMDAAEVNAFLVACLEGDRDKPLTYRDLTRGMTIIESRQLDHDTGSPSLTPVTSANPTPRAHARSVQRQYLQDAEMETDRGEMRQAGAAVAPSVLSGELQGTQSMRSCAGQRIILADNEQLDSASPRFSLRHMAQNQPAPREVVRLGHVGRAEQDLQVETMLHASMRQRCALADNESALCFSPRAVLRRHVRRVLAQSQHAQVKQQAEPLGQREN